MTLTLEHKLNLYSGDVVTGQVTIQQYVLHKLGDYEENGSTQAEKTLNQEKRLQLILESISKLMALNATTDPTEVIDIAINWNRPLQTFREIRKGNVAERARRGDLAAEKMLAQGTY